MASISEAKKALMELYKERKGTARVEFIHPQVLWDKSRSLHWEDPEHAPDVDYMIKMTKGANPAHTHYLQRAVKDENGLYQNDKVNMRGTFGKCNAALAEILKKPQTVETEKTFTFEIYQLRDDNPDRREISFESYADLERRGLKPELGNYTKMYVAGSDILPQHTPGLGNTLESIFEKFNIDRPDDFMGHSLSVSDVVVIGSGAYYIDKAGFKPLHDFLTDGRDRDRSMQGSDQRKEEKKQDKPDAPEKTAEHKKKKSR